MALKENHPEINRKYDLNDIIDQMDLTATYILLHPKITEYAFFSAGPGTVYKIVHILGHKASLNKYSNIEISSPILLQSNKSINPHKEKLWNTHSHED